MHALRSQVEHALAASMGAGLAAALSATRHATPVSVDEQCWAGDAAAAPGGSLALWPQERPDTQTCRRARRYPPHAHTWHSAAAPHTSMADSSSYERVPMRVRAISLETRPQRAPNSVLRVCGVCVRPAGMRRAAIRLPHAQMPMKPSPSLTYNNLTLAGQSLFYAHTIQASTPADLRKLHPPWKSVGVTHSRVNRHPRACHCPHAGVHAAAHGAAG